MSSDVFLIILLASIMHAIWNGMVKKHPDKIVAVSAIVFGHVPISIVFIFFSPVISLEAIPYLVASALIHQGYNWYLLSSYKFGELTKVYPIARGFGPLVATIISISILGLVLNKFLLLSIFCICLGIMLIGYYDKAKLNNKKILKYSLFTGFFIGIYSLLDGYGARISSSSLNYTSWLFIAVAFFFALVLKLKKKDIVFKKVFNEGKYIFWIGGTLSYVIYAIVIWGFTKAPIPLVGALRETSIFFSLVIGYFFLKEKISPTKFISIIIIAIGAIGLKIIDF